MYSDLNKKKKETFFYFLAFNLVQDDKSKSSISWFDDYVISYIFLDWIELPDLARTLFFVCLLKPVSQFTGVYSEGLDC